MDKALHKLLGRHFNLTGLMDFGTNVAAGAIVDCKADVPTVIGHVDTLVGKVSREATPEFDIDLSLTRTTAGRVDVGGMAPAGSAAVEFTLRQGRDIAVVIDPSPGEQLVDLLALARAIDGLGSGAWNYERYAVVKRTFGAAKGEIYWARSKGGTVRVSGSTAAVSRALSGKIDAGASWSYSGVDQIRFSNNLGVHLVRFKKKGGIVLV